MIHILRTGVLLLLTAAMPAGAGAQGERAQIGCCVWAGTARDMPALVQVTEQAVEAGDTSAMVNRALQFENTATFDAAQGARWRGEALALYRRAAGRGDVLGEIAMGVRTLDTPEGAKWFARALRQGSARGMAFYGYVLFHGRGGLAPDRERGIACYKAARDKGDAAAARFLSDLSGVYKAPAQPWIEGDALAETALLRGAAGAGDAGSMVNLGWLHERGEGGMAESIAEAARLYRAAAEAGNAVGLTNLAALHVTGRGVPRDEKTAAALYARAAALGDERAQAALAALWLAGRGGLAGTDAAALAALQATAARESPPGACEAGWAVVALARFHRDGARGAPRDAAAARRLAERASNRRCGSEETRAEARALLERL